MVMFQAFVFYGIASCVTHLYVQNIIEHYSSVITFNEAQEEWNVSRVNINHREVKLSVGAACW